ncbi:MAG: hypothetical protein KFB93_06225 [Simkaniaceae bacterium]|nr:MAG: hypothetical protein KFB93_06225 [Simkaniaceae bacterium]
MLLYKPKNRSLEAEMSLEITPDAFEQLHLAPIKGYPVEDQVSTPTVKLGQLVQGTLDVKLDNKAEIEAKRENFWEKYKINDLDSDFWLVAGDFFSMGYLTFEAAQSFSPALQTVSLVQTLSTIFGVIGGVINIAVGISCIAQGVKKLNKGQTLDGARLIFDGILMILIGTLMVAGPLLLKFAAGTAIAAVVTNPYVLPVLFALLSVFITYEVLKKLIPMWEGVDLGTQVMKKLDEVINDNKQAIDLLNLLLPKTIKVQEDGGEEIELEVNLDALKEWIKEGKEDRVKKVLCKTMNRLETEVGIESALEMFELMKSHLDLLAAHETEIALMQEEQLTETQASLLKHLVGVNIGEMIQGQMDLESSETFERITQAVQVAMKELQEELSPLLQEKHIIPIEPYQIQDGLIEQVVKVKLEQAVNIRKIQEQKPELQKQLRKWKIIQHVRLGQQVLYIGASIASFGSFLPHANANLINGVVNSSMALANFIPLLLDKLDNCKFYRNVPVDVPGVTLEALGTKMAQKALDHPSQFYTA